MHMCMHMHMHMCMHMHMHMCMHMHMLYMLIYVIKQIDHHFSRPVHCSSAARHK